MDARANLEDAMREACRAVGIVPPQRTRPGVWVQTPVEGKARNNRSGRVMIFPDGGGGCAWNWATGRSETFRVGGAGRAGQVQRPARDFAAERRREAERREVAAMCEQLVQACSVRAHPYLERKGFPAEVGLVIEREALGAILAEPQRRALPEGDGAVLVVPGRVGKQLTTVQFITPEGAKKNILGGAMSGACRRIAAPSARFGPIETWVCEGIATALSVRAALRMLGRRATVLSAFSAHNVATVATRAGRAVIAADHDRPLEQFGGRGTGEHYAAGTGLPWVMPPEPGDWNDHHQAHGLRAVALALREVRPP